MSLARGDRSLQEELDWAVQRLAEAGYPLSSKVRLLVDPKLEIMGYASEEGGVQHVVVAEWALQSEMFGGLLFHELAHIYHTERRSPSHRPKLTEAIITEFSQTEGLNERETGYLVEGFSHLQNIIVDDIVFAAMTESERWQAKGFFSSWLTESPSGYPLVDASALIRNAFALASLKRHGLLRDDDPEVEAMKARSQNLLEPLGRATREEFEAIEGFLIEARTDWDEETFRREFARFLDLLLALLRQDDQTERLR